jgi:tetratricopeptide (TPR) repeat protein
MGLRTVTLDATPTPQRPQDWRRRVDETIADAATAVRNRRIDELKAIFAGLAEWDEPQRAYQARVQLVELAFSHASTLPTEAWLKLYAVTAGALLDVLEAEPREPVLLNYAGVLLHELTEFGGAEELFKAAAALDRELPHVDANLREARRRKRSSRQALRAPFAATVAALGARARRIAQAAKPVAGLTVSLCMIVKDEEEMLPGCLEAARDFVDEMIVVDTGSSDRTAEIAREAGAKLVEFPWNGSFADARNVSLEHATSDWILYLDADEHLVPDDAPAFRALLGRTWREAFYLVETNYTGGEESGSAVNHLAMRLFRNRPAYRFEGRIHEQKTGAMPTFLPERFETSTVRVRHYGYLKSRQTAKDKSRRNIELLEVEARENPSPFNAFNLGSEYVALGQGEQARTRFESAWEALRSGGAWHEVPYAPMLVSRLAAVRRELGDLEAARALAGEALLALPGFTDLVLQEALCARDAGDTAEAIALTERCIELGDAPAKYSPTVGAGTYLALCLLAELRPEQAEELYRRSLEEYPSYVGPVLPLATTMLARGAGAEETAAAIAAEKPSSVLLLATALYEAGHTEAAEASFRRVLDRQPGNGPARIGLVESLLSQKRYAEASAEAAVVDQDSPLAVEAASSRLFALAAAGDAPGVRAALPAATAVGVPAPDLELYGAWAGAIEGGATPTSLPAAAAPTAATCLEALLRVQEIDSFATLLPLYDAIAVSPRERRETLARMYLRRGFLASAADEWIAVVEQSPDPRALVGLSQVALAQDLPEDALEFARAAVELAPYDREALDFQETLERRLAAA